MLFVLMPLARRCSIHCYLGTVLVGITSVTVLGAQYPQEFGKDEVVLSTTPPYDDLIPRENGQGRWGYVRAADAVATVTESSAKEAAKVGVEEAVEPPRRWQIAPRFDEANLFQEGAASVKMGAVWGFIDESGGFFVPPKYSAVSEFVGGYAAVCLERRWGYINRHGNVVIPPQYEDALPFIEGLAPVSRDGKYGYINTEGAFVIPPQFDGAEMFSEGLAVVSRASKMFYILRDGKPLTHLVFDRAETFRYGRAAVLEGNRWGVIDSLGRLVVPFQYEAISSQYSEGLAAAKSAGKWGYIDLRGVWVLHPSYEKANDFVHGFAVVVRDNALCVIDPLGNVKRTAPIAGRAERETHVEQPERNR